MTPNNGYVCFWLGKRLEIYAPNLLSAKQQAIDFWHVPRSRQHQVTAVLAILHGEPVIHSGAEL